MFLHDVLDLWFENEVKPRLAGPAFLIRYADDFTIGFRDQRDAEHVLEVIPKRFSKYGLARFAHRVRRGNEFVFGGGWQALFGGTVGEVFPDDRVKEPSVKEIAAVGAQRDR